MATKTQSKLSKLLHGSKITCLGKTYTKNQLINLARELGVLPYPHRDSASRGDYHTKLEICQMITEHFEKKAKKAKKLEDDLDRMRKEQLAMSALMENKWWEAYGK